MYSSLLDAPINTELVILEITEPSLETWLNRLGLFVGGKLTRHDQDFNYYSVRVRGPKGDVVLPAGLATKVYAHLNDGNIIPLTEMKKNQEAHIEIHSGGVYLAESLERLGLKEDTQIKFLRALPHMDYITVINRKERTRLSEGEAAKIWGFCEKGQKSQFYFAKPNQAFEVTDIMGGPQGVRHLKTHGVTPGVSLVLETVEAAQGLHAPRTQSVTVSSPQGLRLYLAHEKAGAVIVRTGE